MERGGAAGRGGGGKHQQETRWERAAGRISRRSEVQSQGIEVCLPLPRTALPREALRPRRWDAGWGEKPRARGPCGRKEGGEGRLLEIGGCSVCVCSGGEGGGRRSSWQIKWFFRKFLKGVADGRGAGITPVAKARRAGAAESYFHLQGFQKRRQGERAGRGGEGPLRSD